MHIKDATNYLLTVLFAALLILMTDFYIIGPCLLLDCGHLSVVNGLFNGTATTCGVKRVLTCDSCYDRIGSGAAVCEEDETWTFDSICLAKGNYMSKAFLLRHVTCQSLCICNLYI